MSKSAPVLVLPRAHCKSIQKNPDFRLTLPWQGWHWPQQWSWLSRDIAETDENFLQVIPYVVLRNSEGKFWAYARGKSDEARLNGKCSIGVGGHIDDIDMGDTFKDIVSAALARELHEELRINVNPSKFNPAQWIYDGTNPVGRVHLGLVYVLPWPDFIEPKSAERGKLIELGFVSRDEILNNPRFETWSVLAAEALSLADRQNEGGDR